MHDTKRGAPCGLDDDHKGNCRTVAGVARERARRLSRHFLDTNLRWKHRNPGRHYLSKRRAQLRARGVVL